MLLPPFLILDADDVADLIDDRQLAQCLQRLLDALVLDEMRDSDDLRMVDDIAARLDDRLELTPASPKAVAMAPRTPGLSSTSRRT